MDPFQLTTGTHRAISVRVLGNMIQINDRERDSGSEGESGGKEKSDKEREKKRGSKGEHICSED